MAIYYISISGDGTNSVPPSADPSELYFQKSDEDNVHFKNNTAFELVLTFDDQSAFNPHQLVLAPNSGSNVAVNESSEDGNFYYDIHYDGMPGLETKPFIYLSSTPITGGNPNQGTSST